MLHFARNLFFSKMEVNIKNASEPLQTLGSPPINFVHQMLHRCNIFKENSLEIPSQNLSGYRKAKIGVIRDSDPAKLNASE
ncbi:hypothetical protein C6500_11465 [Candidatus Poribacteria bacterium]|nr:MAG: hypothetical protein C6500_11465 [Candidatus Poribacteria bacterium]